MENQNVEIKRANRKALPKFLVVVVISAVVGAVIGFLSARFEVDRIVSGATAATAFFAGYVAPWLLLALAVAMPAVCVPMYRSAKKRIEGWDGEDERVADDADYRISQVIWLLGCGNILSFLLIAAVYSQGRASMESDNALVMIGYVVGVAAFIAELVEDVLLSQRCVDAVKRISPEKKASVYDMRFQKKWLESCDEAERVMIGQSAFRAYRVTNAVCGALAVVLTLGALLLQMGFLPMLAVCVVWMANHTAFCLEAMRLSKTGKGMA